MRIWYIDVIEYGVMCKGFYSVQVRELVKLYELYTSSKDLELSIETELENFIYDVIENRRSYKMNKFLAKATEIIENFVIHPAPEASSGFESDILSTPYSLSIPFPPLERGFIRIHAPCGDSARASSK